MVIRAKTAAIGSKLTTYDSVHALSISLFSMRDNTNCLKNEFKTSFYSNSSGWLKWRHSGRGNNFDQVVF